MSISKYASKADFENRSLADRLSDEADAWASDGFDDLALLLNEAREENKRLTKDAEMWRSWRERALKAETENNQLRKDTDRLAFVYSAQSHKNNALLDLEIRMFNNDIPTIEEVRAAIDAARSKP